MACSGCFHVIWYFSASSPMKASPQCGHVSCLCATSVISLSDPEATSHITLSAEVRTVACLGINNSSGLLPNVASAYASVQSGAKLIGSRLCH